MKILYFHGLDGTLSEDKNQTLMPYGIVTAPQIDYRADPDIISTLHHAYADSGFDVIIGNSMGGFAAYYLSGMLQQPCLIFNPALPYRSVPQAIPETAAARTKFLQVVIGAQDDLILAKDNLLFLQQHLTPEINARIHVLNPLGHRIPIAVFERELKGFFEEVGK